MENNPTWLPVVALALQGEEGRWLLHQRPADKHHGFLWEFPGGKVEPGESPRNALIREIGEELGIALDPAALATSVFAEGDRARTGERIVVMLYTSSQWRGEPHSREGGAIGWFTRAEMDGLAMPPADRGLVALLFD